MAKNEHFGLQRRVGSEQAGHKAPNQPEEVDYRTKYHPIRRYRPADSGFAVARTKRRQSGAGLRALGLELLVKKLRGSNFRVTTIGHFAPPRCKIKRSTGMPRLSRNPLGGAPAAGLNIFVRRRDIPGRAIHQTVVLVVALLALFANPLDGLTRCYHLSC